MQTGQKWNSELSPLTRKVIPGIEEVKLWLVRVMILFKALALGRANGRTQCCGRAWLFPAMDCYSRLLIHTEGRWRAAYAANAKWLMTSQDVIYEEGNSKMMATRWVRASFSTSEIATRSGRPARRTQITWLSHQLMKMKWNWVNWEWHAGAETHKYYLFWVLIVRGLHSAFTAWSTLRPRLVCMTRLPNKEMRGPWKSSALLSFLYGEVFFFGLEGQLNLPRLRTIINY